MKILILAILFLASVLVQGQNVTKGSTPSLQLLGSAGGTYKNSSYQLDWSVGEILTQTYLDSQNSLAQGFHQGKYAITAINQAKYVQFEITVFPNPATDVVVLCIDKQQLEDLSYLLTDMNGKILHVSKISTNQQQINLNGIAAGSYFLNVRSGKSALKTFKIIKSN
jgi:hypothetical protein